MKYRYLIAFLIALCVAGAAWAGTNSEKYEGLPTSPADAVDISGATAADALTFDTPIAGRMAEINGNPTIYVSCELATTGDTCLIYVILFRKNGASYDRIGVFSSTATAGAGVSSDGDKICNTLAFDSGGGATHYEVRNGAPSAGNVDAMWWAGASDPVAGSQ